MKRFLVFASLAALSLGGCSLLEREASTDEAFSLPAPQGDEDVTLEPQTVAPGAGTVSLDIVMPEGWHVNVDAPPFEATWIVDGVVVQMEEADKAMRVVDPVFPLDAPVVLSEGDAVVLVDVRLYYCNDDQTLCTIDRRRVSAPVVVSGQAVSNEITIGYVVVPPAIP